MGSNIGLFEIASAAGDLFIHSQDINQKRLLLRFIFESLQIKEGTIHYKLNFPFSEMVIMYFMTDMPKMWMSRKYIINPLIPIIISLARMQSQGMEKYIL